MHLGFALPVSGPWATPDRVRHVATRAETLGYRSLWTFQRLLYIEGIGDPYRSVLDPIVPLAFAAAATSRIRLGIGLVNAPFVAPAVFAKQVASLDVLSGGRVDAGLGAGWNPAEFAATGANPAERGARLTEYVEVVRSLLGPDPVEHHGRFYEIPPSSFAPKPVQQPVPILIGGGAPAALRRIGRIADGWISSSRADLATIGDSIGAIRASAERAGRDASTLRFVCRGAVRVRPGGTPDRGPLTGSLDEIHSDVHKLARLGITEFFFDLNFDPHLTAPGADPDEALAQADRVLEAFAEG